MNDEDFVRELARRVRLHRRYRGMTQQQLADLTGLSRSFVALLETGCYGIHVVGLRRVAVALGVAFSALVDDPTDQGSPLTTERERTYLRALGLRVKPLRVASRLSPAKLGEAADVTRVQVGSIERGDHPANLLAYVRLAAALGLRLPDFVDPDIADGEVIQLLGSLRSPSN
jgi:transcriptional regulator with XRE-family HTH domain